MNTYYQYSPLLYFLIFPKHCTFFYLPPLVLQTRYEILYIRELFMCGPFASSFPIPLVSSNKQATIQYNLLHRIVPRLRVSFSSQNGTGRRSCCR